jgi:hypothetical protein
MKISKSPKKRTRRPEGYTQVTFVSVSVVGCYVISASITDIVDILDRLPCIGDSLALYTCLYPCIGSLLGYIMKVKPPPPPQH